MEPASSTDESSIRRLGSIMRPRLDTSYDMVEGDDYEAADPRRSNSLRRPAPAHLDTSARSLRSASPDPPLRSPSSDHPVPLSHPTPDLQSLQGAYLGNVESLERSAECLSSSSADIGSEIRKMDQEQKRRSGSSASNSTVARESDFSSTGPASLAHGSTHGAPRLRSASGSHLAQIVEPDHDQGYEFPAREPITPTLPQLQVYPFIQHESNLPQEDDTIMSGDDVERPSTGASNDTFQQAKKLFNDFDGVHFVSHENGQESVSLSRPPLATGSESHKQPQSGENMVFYPAPVPMMLNLPPRLSRKPAAEREKRRTQLLSALPPENRKSAPWLSGQDQEVPKDKKRSKRTTELPPQLRASVFFAPPPASPDIEAKQSSAVCTLESILDASARAPVSAFTDHPFAGHLGSEVYGHANARARSKGSADQRKKHRSRNTLVSKRNTLQAGREESTPALHRAEVDAADVPERASQRADDVDYEARRDSYSSSTDEGTDDSGSWSGEEEGYDEAPDYMGPPNTLLAELHLRKQELKQRGRTAVNSVGLHSTLLELDAVAQKQSEHRRQKRITLAWESPDLDQQHEDEDNEDVPLAMLYPDKAHLPEELRPMGLMEKREMEEGEPLSRRRARLRGESPPDPAGPEARASTINLHRGAGLGDSDSGEEGETLGQRLKRLKAQNRTSTAAESTFTTEVLAEITQLNGEGGNDGNDQEAGREEETLAQRRTRLQREANARRGIDLKGHKPRQSMAELSQVRPATGAGTLQPSYEPPPRNSMDPRVCENRMSMQALSQHGRAPSTGYPQAQGYAAAVPNGYALHPNTLYSDAILGMNNLAYAASGSYPRAAKPIIDNGQRDMINRWRQSIK